MRIALLGTRALGTAVLDRLLDLHFEVMLVTENEDANKKLAQLAMDRHVPTIPWYARHPEWAIGHVKHFAPDVIFAAHWNAYVPKALREVSPVGVVAYHPSILPWHRGNHAVQDIIETGKGAGGTIYVMDDGWDTGDIVFQRWAELRHDDDASALWRRELFPIGVELIEHAALQLARGQHLPTIPQSRVRAR